MLEMFLLFLITIVLYFLFSVLSLPHIDWWLTGVICFFLNLLDTWTTQRGIRRGREERNPLWAFLFKKIGVKWAQVVSVLGAIVFIFFFWKDLEIAFQVAWLVTYGLIIVSNYKAGSTSGAT